ncbi:zinc finger BED domain-containing protein 5-like [Oratosquilla oratoria]|uniref:zinc finger BED domain-containing protein 5-like n=1 Tax=Oratosquilla oratoria TaxID=337810 RepID=UPI003F76AB64
MTVNRMFTQKVTKIDRGMLSSYKISNLIAKAGKPHTIGESLIMPVVAIVLSTVMKLSPQEVTSIIPLSNSSVSRRIDEMAADVESQVVLKLFLGVDGIRGELIFALKLTTDTKSESIFKKLEAYFEENNILLKNIVACTTDVAAAMIGSCQLDKENALQDRLFQQLCGKNNEELERLVLHTEVRWLSKCNCLQRFVALWGSVISFLSETELGQKLVDAKNDILYLSDIFEKLNVQNKELQGNDSTLFSCKEAITASIGKLKLFWLNLGRREFAQFLSLASISTELLDADLVVYVSHLK